MPRFRKKPVVIEAIRLGSVTSDEVISFMGGEEKRNIDFSINTVHGHVHIVTLEGTMRADPGDWIIRGVKGEYYPCKPDIFDTTYEPESVSHPASARGDTFSGRAVGQRLQGTRGRRVLQYSSKGEVKITDLEMTRLCAEAMGCPDYIESPTVALKGKPYDPIRDAEQRWALIKQFPVVCLAALDDVVHGDRCVTDASLDRAPVEAVAKMRAAQQKEKGE